MYGLKGILPTFITAFLLAIFPKHSAGQFTLSAELRIRPEVLHGYRTLPDTDSRVAVFVDQRARINALYSKEKFQVYASIQEARTWGEQAQLADEPTIGVHEFWGQYFFHKNLSLKAGRQELRYDDERLLGNADWYAQGRSHDAAVLKYANAKGFKLDAGGAFNQATQNNFGTYYPVNSYKTLEYLWANKVWKNSHQELNVSAMVIGDGTQEADSTGITTRVTIGFNSDFTREKFALHLAVYDQLGQDPAKRDISAYMISAYGTVNPFEYWKFTLGIDYLSGTDQLNSENADKQKTFFTLYPSNHAFYGIADYFLNIPNDTKNGGLIDAFFKANCTMDKFKINGAFHMLALQNNVVVASSPETALDKNLGTEIDVWGSYNFEPEVSIMLGGSLMFGTESMEAIKGGDSGIPGKWIYAGITFKPVFFSSQK